MTNRDPVVRRAGPPSPQKIVLWAVVIGDLLMLGVLIYVFDDLGFFQGAWGWPVFAAIAIVAGVQFLVPRHILVKGAQAKSAQNEEQTSRRLANIAIG